MKFNKKKMNMILNNFKDKEIKIELMLKMLKEIMN